MSMFNAEIGDTVLADSDGWCKRLVITGDAMGEFAIASDDEDRLHFIDAAGNVFLLEQVAIVDGFDQEPKTEFE